MAAPVTARFDTPSTHLKLNGSVMLIMGTSSLVLAALAGALALAAPARPVFNAAVAGLVSLPQRHAAVLGVLALALAVGLFGARTASAHPPPVNWMVAFGDSYTSGEGIVPDDAGTTYDCGTDVHKGEYYENTTAPFGISIWHGNYCDIPTSSYDEPAGWRDRPRVVYENLCHRSPRAYPNQIRAGLLVPWSAYQLLACSGAVTENIGFGNPAGCEHRNCGQYPLSPYGVAGGKTQVDTVDPSVSAGTTGLVTVGVGGNDAQLIRVIKACLGDCLHDTEFIRAVIDHIHGYVFGRLRTTFAGLRSTFPNATVVALGYPNVIGDPDNQECAFHGGSIWGLQRDELIWARDTYLPAINDAIQRAAREAGVVYADISGVLSGHELCSDADQRWVNGLRLGDDNAWIPESNESLHPNQWGHDRIAHEFVRYHTDGFGRLTVFNPQPQTPTPVPDTPAIWLGNVNAGSACGSACLQGPTCVQGCSLGVNVHGFAPDSTLSVTLHSEPTRLGSLTTDQTGAASGEFRVPYDIEPGIHELQLRGVSADGAPQYGNSLVNVLPGPPPAGGDQPPHGRAQQPASEQSGTQPVSSTRAAREVAVSARWRVNGRATRLLSLRALRVSAGSTVRVGCRAPAGKRRACPFSVHRIAVKTAAATLRLDRPFRRPLPAGTVLTVTITKPGFAGRRYAFRVRARRQPARTVTVV